MNYTTFFKNYRPKKTKFLKIRGLLPRGRDTPLFIHTNNNKKISFEYFSVIWDRTNFKVDHMQRLTYKL
jgi:hypothetical protein